LINIAFEYDRKIYFVNGKNQPNWVKEFIMGKESNGQPVKGNSRITRFVDFIEKGSAIQLQMMDSLDFPMEKIYKFRVTSGNAP